MGGRFASPPTRQACCRVRWFANAYSVSLRFSFACSSKFSYVELRGDILAVDGTIQTGKIQTGICGFWVKVTFQATSINLRARELLHLCVHREQYVPRLVEIAACRAKISPWTIMAEFHIWRLLESAISVTAFFPDPTFR